MNKGTRRWRREFKEIATSARRGAKGNPTLKSMYRRDKKYHMSRGKRLGGSPFLVK